MSLPIPNLDDRTFTDLMEEAKSLIPSYSKEWTNHNPSDPGIMLLELFAWLTEMTIYRINQVPEANYLKFLKLIRTEDIEEATDVTESPPIHFQSDESMESAIRKHLESISKRFRAITSDDYQALALEKMEALQPGLAGRAICVNNRDLDHSTANNEMRGHVSVIIIPTCSGPSAYCTEDGAPTDDLKKEVKNFLSTRRLITTRVHVVAPNYKEIKLDVQISLKENTDEDTVLENSLKSIKEYFDHVTGGPDRSGWPLGRNLYKSEIYFLLEGISDVDHVVEVLINDSRENFIELEENQLILLKPDPTITVVKESHE